MKARIDGMVRGVGYLYVNIVLVGHVDSSSIQVIVSADGTSLPVEWYPIGPDNGDADSAEIVVVAPLLVSGMLDIQVQASTDDGAYKKSFNVTADRAKWESRFTYRLRGALASKIRDIESQDVKERIDIWYDWASPDDGYLLVRGVLKLPYHENSEIAFSVFDGSGKPADIAPIVLGEDVVAPTREDPLRERRQTFSVRVPREVGGFTLAAHDESHSELKGFRSVGTDLCNELLESGKFIWENAVFQGSYDGLFRARRASAAALTAQSRALFARHPLFSIVVPLFQTPVNLFQAMVDSVCSQSYANWELILVNASPEDDALLLAVDAMASADERIRIVPLEKNFGITENTNVGIAVCKGDFVCFLDHDDMLEPSALFEYAWEIEQSDRVDLLYSDEDVLSEGGGCFYSPHFKPDFDIDLLRSRNYVTHFLCVRKTMLDGFETPDSRYDGAQDYNLTLRASEIAREIVHVPKVLYHWRAAKTSTAAATTGADAGKDYANDAGRLALTEHLERLGIPAEVEPGPVLFSYHVKYMVQGSPLVSIIIPNKDCGAMLERCINSVIQKTTYQNFEIVVVDNNSVEPETGEAYKRVQELDSRVKVVTWPAEFNFSKIINFGAQHAKGDYLLPLNNDTEVISPEWLESMLGICQRKDVGVVGAFLLFPDNTIQHAGVVIVDKWEPPQHAYYALPKSNTGHFDRNVLTHQHLAVTGACFITKRSVFDEVGGFTEAYAIAYNDIDYCFKVRDKGLAVVLDPTAQLYHYESVTRGFDLVDEKKRIRLFKEGARFISTWPDVFVKGDPFLNPNIGTSHYRLRWK